MWKCSDDKNPDQKSIQNISQHYLINKLRNWAAEQKTSWVTRFKDIFVLNVTSMS
jgi:hypothetical protein